MADTPQSISMYSEKKHPVIGKNVPCDLSPDWQSGTVILIDKPKGWSSFKAVYEVRKCIGFKKIGHAGTLDPMATGLLVLCTGRATKVIESIQSGTKKYAAEITFGGSTPSYDAETEIDEEAEYHHLSQAKVQGVLDQEFTGKFLQKAPAYSALKHKGKPLYKLAREGKEVPIKERFVEIYKNDISSFDLPKLELNVHCGKGTYIRSLAHDLALRCGTRAYLSALRRTEVSPFNIHEAFTIEAFRNRFCNDSVNSI